MASKAQKAKNAARKTKATAERAAANRGGASRDGGSKGLSQKQLALKYGGKYSEGGFTYTVSAPGQGGGVQQSQESKSNYPDSARAYQRYRMSEQGAVPISKKTQTSTSEFTHFDEEGEVSAGPIPQQTQQKRDFKTGSPNPAINILKDTRERFAGGISDVKNFVTTGIQGGSGAILSPRTRQQKRDFKTNRPVNSMDILNDTKKELIRITNPVKEFAITEEQKQFKKLGMNRDNPIKDFITANIQSSKAQNKPPLKIQQPKRDFRKGGLRSQTDFIQDTKQRLIGISDPIKNFVLGGMQAEISRGSNVVMTSSGKAYMPKNSTVNKIFQGIEKQKTKNTLTEKLIRGRLGQIDLADPRTQGQIGGNIALIASPLGAKGISKGSSGIKTSISKSSREKQITSLENRLILPRQSEKLPFGGKLTGIGEETVITGGGREGVSGIITSKSSQNDITKLVRNKQIPMFVTKFGKGKTTTERIDPLEKPILSSEKVTLFGKLDRVTKKEMGAIQTGNFQYTSNLAKGVNKRIFQKGTFEGEIKQFATGKERLLKDVLKSPQPDPFDSAKVTNVFGQTKAEKLIPNIIGSRNIGTRKTSLNLGSAITGKGGAGQAGKGASLTKQQEKLIKQTSTPTKPTTQKQSGYSGLIIPGYTPMSQSQVLEYPPSQKSPNIISGYSNPQSSRNLITPDIITPKIKQTPDLLTPSITTTPPKKLIVNTNLVPPTEKPPGLIQTPRQGQRQITRYRIGSPTKQTTTRIQPPTELIPPVRPTEKLIFPKIPFIVPPYIPRGTPKGGGYSRPSGRTLSWIGNVPETSIIGIYNRPEIIYSNESSYGSALSKSLNYRPKKSKSKIQFKSDRELNITGKKSKRKSSTKQISSKGPKISFGGKGKKLKIF